MACFFRKKRIQKYTLAAKRYISENFEEELVVRSVYKQLLDDIARAVSENDTNNNEDVFEEYESEATDNAVTNQEEEFEETEGSAGGEKTAEEPRRRNSYADEEFLQAMAEFDWDDESDADEFETENFAEEQKPTTKSPKGKKGTDDRYHEGKITLLMRNLPNAEQTSDFLSDLDRSIDVTFVDKLIYYINKKGMRDSHVYKAAQVDKRLFSKIMSDKNYKPSKDTAIALSFALGLTLTEATDLLSRAGYTLSHSNKRDVIIEYFFREGVHNLIDINEVLFSLNQKTIGRNN